MAWTPQTCFQGGSGLTEERSLGCGLVGQTEPSGGLPTNLGTQEGFCALCVGEVACPPFSELWGRWHRGRLLGGAGGNVCPQQPAGGPVLLVGPKW